MGLLKKQITRHFSWGGDKMLICPCCKAVKLTDTFWYHLHLLENLRTRFDQPIVINSGYRCKKHNKKVGGSRNSWHMKFATDIRPAWKKGDSWRVHLKEVERLRMIAIEVDFTGIGTYKWFVHVDTRPKFTTWEG